MSIEYADDTRQRKGASRRKVTVAGKTEYTERKPEEIARELRAKSPLGVRERRLAKAEAQLGKR